MTARDGWQPFTPPRRPQTRVTSAFARLAHTHLASTAADAALATALAGSLFFTLPSGEARGKVLLYLIFTMAPFSIVAPLIGPLLDRIHGGRRLMVIVSAVGRALLCLIMMRHVKSFLFFPEAFGVLVLQKTYAVTKPALVPSTVTSDDELVEANSKLSLLSGIGSVLGAPIGGLAYKLAGGAQGALVVAMSVYALAAVLATRLPKEQVAAAAPSSEEREELHSTSILLGASAMGMLRGIVGFMTVFIAFAFYRKSGTPWELAVVGGSSVAGSQVGALLAPWLRRMTKEENLLMGALGVTTLAALAATMLNGLPGAMVLAVNVGVCAATAKLAFDSIVQRDAPDANRGRSFAKFETRFQILWVLGALVAITPMPKEAGYVIVLVVAGLGLFSYLVGSKASEARRRSTPLSSVDAAAIELDQRMNRIADQARQRVWSAATNWRHRRSHGRQQQNVAAGPLPPPTGRPVWVGADPPPPGAGDAAGAPGRSRPSQADSGGGLGAGGSRQPSGEPGQPGAGGSAVGGTDDEGFYGAAVGAGATQPFEPSPMTFGDVETFEEPQWRADPSPDPGASGPEAPWPPPRPPAPASAPARRDTDGRDRPS